MARYVFRPEAERKIERAGLSQAELARRSDLSKYGIRDKLRKGQRTRGATAWKIARVIAQEAGITEDQAFDELFAEVPDAPPAPSADAQRRALITGAVR
jgi:transcriptional regulator with XRE-family HTH domain